ncbi:MAG TPA: T9SS type A sorting domain-containing protein [Bacteroidota bacterium]|nr:T9SS type A sorting domain-containing protein [Bacteroidota bacterium]
MRTQGHRNFEGREEHEASGDAWGAFEWWYNQRALPYEVIPSGAFQRAAQQAKAISKLDRNRSASSTVPPWTSIGPTNVGGRVLSIAVNPSNPNIVWLGSASGGIWKSTSGGQGPSPWSYVSTGFPALSISAIVIDSSNPNVMYIGTGEISRYQRPLVGVVGARSSYGLGILKSTDGGATWDTTGLQFTFPQMTAVEKIILNPRNTRTVYAATSEGVAKSTDAGATWTMVNTELMAMDIVINPADTTILYSSHGNLNSTNAPGIYYSDDAGANWILLGGGLPASSIFGRTALSISQTNPSTVYAGVSHGSSGALIGLYKTINGGTTWTAVSTTNYVNTQGWYDNVVAVDPTNANNVYCSGFDIYQSTSGGAGLAGITNGGVHVDHHAITFDPTNPQVMYFGCDGGIYKSTDGGGSFLNLNNGFVTTQFYPGFVCAKDDSNFALGGLQDNGTVQYLGSGTWNSIFGGDGGWCGISSANKYTIYCESQYMNLVKSTNGGSSFTSATSGLPPTGGATNYNFIPPFAVSYSNPNVLYAGSKNVYKSTNAGATWFAPNNNGNVGLNGTFISCIGISSTHHDTVMAGTGSGLAGGTPTFEIFSSTNGGTSWSNVTGTLPDRYPTDIEYDPRVSTTAYVTYSGYGTPHVYKTTNLGGTWTNISSNLPDIPHQAITIDPEEPVSIFVGTDLGVYHSANGGATWEEFNTGMPPAMVLDLTASRSNGMLRAATFGNGVYQRKFPRTATLALGSPNGGEIYAAGLSASITWSEQYLESVKLEYSTDNGTSWNLIANNVPAWPQKYSWIVPQLSTTQGRIRISETSTGLFPDSSDAAFTILLNPDVISGWNMLSVDLSVPDNRKSTLYGSAISPAYTYMGSYVQRDTIANGTGYWLKFVDPQFTTYGGDSVFADTINVKQGWNMIGSISVPVATSSIAQIPPGIVTSPYYGYLVNYSIVSSIDPKRGTWVKTNADGKLVLSSSMNSPKAAVQSSDPFAAFEKLSIRDHDGKQQSLYYTNQAIATEQYEMPPLPPAGAYDVRYSSQRSVAQFSGSGTKEFPVSVSGAAYPIILSWNSGSLPLFASLVLDGKDYSMANSGSIEIHSENSEIRLKLSLLNGANIPIASALLQNYPNPFNPVTTIDYQIATAGNVKLKIFDVAGREITTLVSEFRQPGAYRTSWDASGVSSGIYFSKLVVTPLQTSGAANPITSIRKMVLLK